MSKHTAGKWELVDHDAYPSMMEIKGASFRVVIVMGATDLTFEDYLKRKEDALKMAAAPELLEQLRQSTEMLERILDDEDWGAIEEQIQDNRSAIAKATGGEE